MIGLRLLVALVGVLVCKLPQAQQLISNDVLHAPGKLPAAQYNEAKDSLLFFFQKADSLMEIDRYDSAEYYLNLVGLRLKFSNPVKFNFYYHTRYAEVYYYNNLLQLGQQQASRALLAAQQIGDSIFIADAYNFLGLFSMNLGKNTEAVNYLSEGLAYTRSYQPRVGYLPLSEAYHLHGNLGEAFYRLKKYAAALQQFDSSIHLAIAKSAYRAQALALINSGEVYLDLRQNDSAYTLTARGTKIALQSGDYDVFLHGNGLLAYIIALQQQKDAAYAKADSGMQMLKSKQGLNPYYTLLFLRTLVKMYSYLNDYRQVASVQSRIIYLEDSVRKRSNLQMEKLLAAGLNNEIALLKLQVAEAKAAEKQNRIGIAILFLVIAILVMAGLYYRRLLREKLALAQMREKISQNLHDDIGATLSSLNIYSNLAQSNLKPKPQMAADLLDHITRQSRQLMEDLNDMVWSMKDPIDEGKALKTKVLHYGVDLLNARNIECDYDIDDEVMSFLPQFEARKNLLLIIKEGINNMAKYSEATQASVVLKRQGSTACLRLTDNGIGFEPNKITQGNGLKHMQKRAKELNARFELIASPGNGTTIILTIPLKNKI
ncbi:MAG: histidine kinase [Chitinophagaceae bacterium]|nr:histidine kinase [Chitinophagaceae bacterium]